MAKKIIIGLLVITMVVSGGFIVRYILDASSASGLNDSLRNIKDATPAAGASGGDVLAQYAQLYTMNPDLAGWLTIDGTNIDYPVMQSAEENGQYYLNRNFNREEDVNGSLFVDIKSSLQPRSTNLLIHGHNMKSGAMFHNLRHYKDKQYLLQHPTIQFDTLYETASYQIVAVIETKVLQTGEEGFRYYSFFDAATEQEFNDFAAGVQANSLYDTGHTLHYGDQLLTLSTCDYAHDNGRLAIIAKKI